jgi:hypothetical protein
MDKFGIKGTLYDLLAYILPGAILLIWVIWMFQPYGVTLKMLIASKGIILIGFICIAYISGQLISAIGAFALEGPTKRFIVWLLGKTPLKIVLISKTELPIIDGLITNDKLQTSRNIIALVQSKYPSVYDTAFVFLSIYGLSRNISTVIFMCLFVYCFSSGGHGNQLMVFSSLAVALIFLYNYFRFKHYFNAQIQSGVYLLTIESSSRFVLK